MKIKQIVDMGATLIIATVAVVVGFTYVQQRNATPDAVTYESARQVSDWEAANAGGIRKGPPDAPIVITEFMDFECPYCVALAPLVDSIAALFPRDVAIVFQHFPLTSHLNALPAAIAAECSYRQGRFWPMYGLLLAEQKSFDSVPWESFAERAGVADLTAFSECVKLPADSFPRIAQGRALGERTGVTGTPTTWINGRVIRPTIETIRKLVR